ncbi:MAG TPA: hypothetical protein VGL32_02330, partial [Acidimicrobiales bacterium]
SLESVARPVATLRRLRREAGRESARFEVTVGGPVATRGDLERWSAAGVDRLVVSPWTRSRQAVEGMRRLADAVLS